MVEELMGQETDLVDYKPMHYSVDNGKSLKVFSKNPTCPGFCFKKDNSEAFMWKMHFSEITPPDDAQKTKCYLTKWVPIAGNEFSFVLAA